jgi:2,4-dienoyl-CoA reductase-like NADH-dependent reductase (Old Yellow Enzyme family)
MSILFTSKKVGPVEVKNRFVAAPVYECMATETGDVTDQLVNKYRAIAKGGTGLIIPGYMSVNLIGRAMKFQIGIHDDKFIPGLRKLTETIHQQGSKIFFEIAHAGRWTTKEVTGQTPVSASTGKADQVFRVKPKAMTNQDIEDTITAFREGARRARDAGADGIHIAASGASLFDQFLSPFLNQRTDEWGSSEADKYRILGDTIKACRRAISGNMALTVKINSNDYTPKPGVTPDLAKKYVEFLCKDGIDGLETSQGTIAYSSMNMWRGEVPLSDYLKTMPSWMRPIGYLMMRRWVGKYDLVEAWNLADTQTIKPAIGNTPLFLVGGMRNLSTMQRIVEQGQADFISLGRPMIREPDLVKKFRTNETQTSACISCNGCAGQIMQNLPLRCVKLAQK